MADGYADRRDAGRRLAAQLGGTVPADAVVLGLPRGGVPVAAEVARALRLPLDVILVRKIGVPGAPELAMGAIGEGAVRVVDDRMRARFGVTRRAFARVEHEERAVIEARARLVRSRFPPIELRGRTAIVVDDGLATGATARAACLVARARGAAEVVLAVPVADAGALAAVPADRTVVGLRPVDFRAVGEAYRDFSPVDDATVLRCLAEARGEGADGGHRPDD